MALGRRQERQQELFIGAARLAQAPGHPFYQGLGQLLAAHDFDAFCEELCAPFYAEVMGRPGLAPGNYFRLLLIGYFEHLDSERRIAWRVADSLSLRQFLGYGLEESTPDHSTLSATRRRLDLAVHQAVFAKVLEWLAEAGLLKGRTLGVDATTLAADASLKNLRQRLTNESYAEYVKALMQQDQRESGKSAKASDQDDDDDPPEPSAEDLARFDRKRHGKKLSNRDWHNPHNPEARIGRMKDGRTRFLEKCEHAVDLETGAVVAVTVQPGDTGDTGSLPETLAAAAANLNQVKDSIRTRQEQEPAPVGPPPARDLAAELVADKGYHSSDTCLTMQELGFRSYLSEPDRGRRHWQDKEAEQQAVYANRRRVQGERGKRLLRQRGELVERPFTHYLDHGGMRRVYLHGHANIAKRLLVHVAGFNLGLILRQAFGAGTPRALADALAGLLSAIFAFLRPPCRPRKPRQALFPINALFDHPPRRTARLYSTA